MSAHRRPLRRIALVLLAAMLACSREATSPPSTPGSPPPLARSPVRVAAASDLTGAFEELGRMFERSTGLPVVFSFGSTGLLARQLSGGAPFDLFAAAHPRFIDDVVAAGVCDPETRALYARGRLALWTRRAGALPAGVAELSQPRFRRIAIANPDHAPYGAAARHVLERTGIWEDVAPRVVLGDNVRQALQFAQTGNADAAIVALALVTHDADNPWMILDESLHPPIEQTLAVCTRGQQRAGGEAFARFVASDTGREVMRRFGFAVPSQAHGPGSAP